ncbi:hypothetical protein HNQ80_002427 [Anaerosolibacter carboniphilus]|uniref:Uncharacterized protein n=1 Tax=Anaerosolibacter carboniphilus TaxID=1417629 RepID=A0A841KSC7_9FIRM|nr:hypothetical protein [Anaerosolibacter carboniphilus]MBB6216327.1 hypothetical protein [Anaerosolibacter carboniphilus]
MDKYCFLREAKSDVLVEEKLSGDLVSRLKFLVFGHTLQGRQRIIHSGNEENFQNISINGKKVHL